MLSSRSRSCPVILGRDTELALGAELLAGTAAGRGALLVVSGEAGIGKSRLTHALIEAATWRGFRHLTGHCHEQDRDFPYAPFLDALRHMVGRGGDEGSMRALAAARVVLARLLPELTVDGEERPAALPPEHEKRRLLEAFVALFERLAADVPLLLRIEDVHWADETSLDLLRLLARRLHGVRVLIVVTARTDEPGRNHDRWLADLARDRLITRIVLAPLSEADVTRMIAAMADDPLPVTDVRAIHARAEGVPLLVEELLYARAEAIETGTPANAGESDAVVRPVPAVVAEMVARRLDGLDTETRQVAEVASAIGQRFSFDLLQVLTRQTEAALVAALRRLVATYLIAESPEDARGFVFRHALTRDAVYHRLLGPERQRLHRRIARALIAKTRPWGTPSDSELGYHAFLAREWALALAHCGRAGAQAQALYAPEAAIEQYSRALVAARHLGASHIEIALRRGEVLAWVGESARAREDYETALEQAHTVGDRIAEWRALMGLGQLTADRDYARGLTYYQRAHAIAQAIGDPESIARSLNRLGHWHRMLDEPLKALHYHTEALACFRSIDHSRGIAETLMLLGSTCYLHGDLIQGATYHRQAVALFEALDDRHNLIHTLAAMAESGAAVLLVPVTARIADRQPEAERALQLARQIGWRFGEAYSQGALAYCLGLQGDYGRAMQMGESALEIAEAIDNRVNQYLAHWVLGGLWLDMLILPRSRWHLDRTLALAHALHSSQGIVTATAMLASLHIATGDLSRADAIVRPLFHPDTPTGTTSERLLWFARAELALACGKPEHALRIADSLTATAPNIGSLGDRGIPQIAKLRGDALAMLGHHTRAEAALHAALETARARGARPLVWRVCCSLIGVCAAQGRGADARRFVVAAREMIEALTAEIPDAATRATFTERATAMIPPLRVYASHDMARARYGGLTARERAVAIQVARGEANRAIARLLSVSEKTVEFHVSNSLRRLGLRSRTELAAWAITSGLAPAPTMDTEVRAAREQ